MRMPRLENRIKRLEHSAGIKELPVGLILMRLGKPPGRVGSLANYHTRENALKAGRYNIQQLEKIKAKRKVGQDIFRWHIDIVPPRGLNEALPPKDTGLRRKTTPSAAEKNESIPAAFAESASTRLPPPGTSS